MAATMRSEASLVISSEGNSDIYMKRPETQPASLASIYQARKSGDNSVNALRQQFQSQISDRPSPTRPLVAELKAWGADAPSSGAPRPPTLQREKSFDEARTAVQSQIERIFQKAAAANKAAKSPPVVGGVGVLGVPSAAGAASGPGQPVQQAPITPRRPITNGTLKRELSLQSLLGHKRQAEFNAAITEEESNKEEEEEAQAATPTTGSNGSTLKHSYDVTRDRGSSTPSSTSTKKAPKAVLPAGVARPFRIHSASTTLSRHLSVDNLPDKQDDTYYTSKLATVVAPSSSANNSDAAKMRGHASSSSSSRTPSPVKTSAPKTKRQAPEKPVKEKKAIASQEHRSGARKSYPSQIQTKANLPPTSMTANVAPKAPRDANLQHLGRMTPEEQLDKFLQSVEEVNAENELILDGKKPEKEEAPIKVETSKPATKNGRNRNLRRESSIANRWHSMDNLNNSNKPKTKLASNPGGKTARPPTSPPKPPAAAKKKTPPLQPSSRMVGMREINGPKSFSSMSELDNMRQDARAKTQFLAGKSATSQRNPGATKSSKAKAPAPPRPNGAKLTGVKKELSARETKIGRSAKSGSSSEESRNKKNMARSQEVESKKPVKPTSHRTKVVYLGSIPLNDQASDLTSLQSPLKDLYFNHMEKRGEEVDEVKPNCTLEISDTGLKINYVREEGKGVHEIFNPFPTIAVWAAVRFVYKRRESDPSRSGFNYAFLPLISDPGDREKDQLFSPLAKRDLKQAVSREHPAMFACIMRRTGAAKHLECHGFVCNSKEDAVKIASNLYKSLMETMRKQQQQQQQQPQQPSRPPRSKNKKRRAASDETSNNEFSRGDTSSVYSQNRIRRSQSAKFPLDEDSFDRRLRRSVSERRSLDDSDTLTRRKAGDIYTKVAMPRSKSFMNVSGQYNLQELFKELRDKEGIESIDDILRHVISREGMSYNKISPMYRELLMKLAMSMSGDEMFIRSKNIIMEQKMKKFRFGGGNESKFKLFNIFKPSNNNNKSMSNIINNNKVSKADISEPIPISEKTKRKLTDQWMKAAPELALAVGTKVNNNNNPKLIPLNKAVAQRAKAPTPRLTPKGTPTSGGEYVDSSYMSCSECGYQSVCGTNCDCSMVTTTADEMTHLDQHRHRSSPTKSGAKSVSSSSTSKSSSSSSAATVSNSSSRKSPSKPTDTSNSTRKTGKNVSPGASATASSQNKSRSNNQGNKPSQKPLARQQQNGNNNRSAVAAAAAATPAAGAKTNLDRNGLQKKHFSDKRSDDSSRGLQNLKRDMAKMAPSIVSSSTATSASSFISSSSYQTCSCHHHSTTADDSETSCYTCNGREVRDSDSEASLGSIESPTTAWKRRNGEVATALNDSQQQVSETSEESSSTEDEEDHKMLESSTTASIMSVIAKVKAAVAEAEAELTSSSLPSTLNSRPERLRPPSSSGPEHVDGFFRNLSMEEDDGEEDARANKKSSKQNFRALNHTVASRQKSRMSIDSLSSSSSSSSSDASSSSEGSTSESESSSGGESCRDLTRRRHSRSQENLSDDSSVLGGRSRGPRPAYSESNMHNSLGYLP